MLFVCIFFFVSNNLKQQPTSYDKENYPSQTSSQKYIYTCICVMYILIYMFKYILRVKITLFSLVFPELLMFPCNRNILVHVCDTNA